MSSDAQRLNSDTAPGLSEPREEQPALAAVLKSREFQKSPASRSLLVFLWRNRHQSLSEFAIATEALGRNSQFDARFDSTVRVQISRLRQRLERYYQEEGRDNDERLVIPLGSYQVRVDTVSPAVVISPIARETNYRRRSTILTAVCAALFVACVLEGVVLMSGAKRQPSAQPSRFWNSFFANRHHTRIVLPTPIFFSFPAPDRHGALMFRDTLVNDFADSSHSTVLQSLSSSLGPPHLADNYTVNSDTFAAIQLEHYLDKSGFETSVRSSADGLLTAMDDENVIAIGTTGTLSPLKAYLDRMDFALMPKDEAVINRHPRPSEQNQFPQIKESDQRVIWPGIIGLLPGRGRQTRLLVLTARHTAALVSFLTSSNGQDQLDRMWKTAGRPEYYEVVVATEMNGVSLVRFWPMALHPFHPQF